MSSQCPRLSSKSAAIFSFFFFNDTATTEIYTLSLHDALPIWFEHFVTDLGKFAASGPIGGRSTQRTGEHTPELPSPTKITCRVLLGKKKNKPRDRSATRRRLLRRRERLSRQPAITPTAATSRP